MNTRATPWIACAATAAIALPLLAAEPLAVKLGLWKNTTTMLMGIQIPPEQQAQLDRMPEAQRAQMEQMMKQMGVGAPRTTTTKSCITEKDLDENAFRDSIEQGGQECETKHVSGTSKRQEWTVSCKTPQGNATGRMVMEAQGNSRVTGSMDLRMPQGSMEMKFEGEWLSASCEGADPK